MWDEYLEANEKEKQRLDKIEEENFKTLNKIIYVLMVLTLASFLMQYTYFK